MEVPVINRISNFEAGINSLHNPSFISQLLALSGIEKIYQPYNIWKWGALILAILASFTTIINRIKILIIKLKNHHNSLSYQPLVNNLNDDDDDEDYDSETETSCSSSDAEEDEEEEEEQNDECFHVRGSGYYLDDQWQNRNLTFRRRRRSSFTDLFSWSENSVVKLWDNLGLALDNTNCMENVFGVYDMNKDQRIASIFGGKREIPAVSTSSNAVVVSAAANESGGVSLRGWDTRVACRIPAIIAEWRPKLGKIVGVNVSGIDKVYVRDDVTGQLTVGDMRKVTSPLANVAESEVDTWWDADAVIVTDECVDEL